MSAYAENVKWLQEHGFTLWGSFNGVETYVRDPLVVKLMRTATTVCVRMVDTEVSGNSPLDAIQRARITAQRMHDKWETIDDALRAIVWNEENGAAEESGYFTS